MNTNTVEVQNFSIATTELTANIRAIRDEKGEPWFVAKDVCRTLEIANTTQPVTLLDGVDKRMLNIGLPGRAPLFVNESGLYDLILNSRKPSAKRFRKWVTSKVLPSIRKNGMYMVPDVAKEAVESPEAFLARAVLVAQQTLLKTQQELAEAKPKAQVFDAVVADKQMTVSEFARALGGVNSMRVKRRLSQQGYFYQAKGRRVLSM
jgi:prophage antirepressor-like protein